MVLIGGLAIIIPLVVTAVLLTLKAKATLEAEAEARLAGITGKVVQMCRMNEEFAQGKLGQDAKVLRELFEYGGRIIPEEGKDFSIVDHTSDLTGSLATIFRMHNTFMLRVATTVRKHDGSRAVGTTIDSDSPVFQAVKAGKTYKGRNKVVNDWCATQYDPVFVDGKVVGCLYVGVKLQDLSSLRNVLAGMRAWTTGYTYVIDSAGKIVFHPDADAEEDASRIAPVAEILKKREGSIRYTRHGQDIIASWQYFEPWDWYVVSQVPARECFSPVQSIVLFSAAALLGCMTLGLATMYSYSRKVLGPVTKLADAADRLARGDRSTQVEAEASGEVALLVESFNRLAVDLENTTVSKNYVNNILNSMIDTLLIVSPDGAIRNCNAAICSLLGYKERDLIGKSVESILGESGKSRGSIVEEVRRQGFLRNRELAYRTADGREIPMLLSASPMYGPSGGFEGVVCVAQDITIRKQAEEDLARLGMAVEQAGEAVVITDADGTIQYVNPSFERLTGYGRDEVLGKNPRILKSGKHDKDFYGTMWNILTQGKVWSGKIVNRSKDGNLFEEFAVISPVRDASGRIVNFVAVKRDLTHEIEMEEQLRQSQKMEAIGKLAGGVAHDFNNLLTVITGYCDLILYGLPKHGPWRHEVEGIKNAADRAAAVTRQLLAFSRKQVFQLKDVDMNDVVANLDGMLRRLIGEDIDLQTSLREDLWNVRIDPAQIEQVIVNTVVNARDAMPEGGKLTIETDNVMLDETYVQTHLNVKPGPYMMLAITDTGCGMDESVRSRIFEPFFTTKEVGKGTGLGLSTVYGIIKQSSGYIWAYSEPDRGTTFKIYLPRVLAGEMELPHVARGAVAAMQGGAETVLLAEDEDLVRELVIEILNQAGYTVLPAHDGVDAMRIAEKHEGPIHLLITDVVMPQMNGRELARRMLASRPDIKVIYISGYTEDAIIHHGVLDPGMHFVQKPFRPGDLVRKIREVLDATETV
ncbi:MAG: Cache 3/Cache 2 fusion domain-containing protein [Deltaproteobacteria bacterium]|nr:Cache 3/Cache 2 fusion domain-containing protein [Deltaproteobacteria bacterium]